MKTFLLWILLAALIWFSNAKSTGETTEASKKGEVERIGLIQNEAKNSSKVSQEKAEISNTKPLLARRKRYATQRPWRKDEFTYSILKYTKDMSGRVQESVFKKAFNLWHEAVPQLEFNFRRNDPDADFKIAFVKGAHGDYQAFDGKGPIIAHVYYPEDGRMHFDDDEW